jgi:NhaA family Na+:H+ antiporter
MQKSVLAHEASIAAGAQGKFWEMHNLLLANQGRLRQEELRDFARGLGLDLGHSSKPSPPTHTHP